MTHLLNINILVPSEQDTYMFVKKQQGNIPNEAVGWVLQTIQYPNDPNADEIVLSEEVFETTLSVFREARDENDCDDSAENREDESDSDEDCGAVYADSVAFVSLRSHRGRHIRPPIRMDL